MPYTIVVQLLQDGELVSAAHCETDAETLGDLVLAAKVSAAHLDLPSVGVEPAAQAPIEVASLHLDFDPFPSPPCLNPDYCGSGDADTLCANCKEV